MSELLERARKVMPGGVSSPVRAFGSVQGEPPFIARGAGARLVDTEGRIERFKKKYLKSGIGKKKS